MLSISYSLLYNYYSYLCSALINKIIIHALSKNLSVTINWNMLDVLCSDWVSYYTQHILLTTLRNISAVIQQWYKIPSGKVAQILANVLQNYSKVDPYLTNKFDVSVVHQPFCPILHKSYKTCVKLLFEHKLPEIAISFIWNKIS